MLKRQVSISRFHTASARGLVLIGAGQIVTFLLAGRCRVGMGGNGGLFWVQAWEGKIRDLVHLVVPRKCE